MNNNLRLLVVGTFSFLGCLCITSGILMPKLAFANRTTVTKLYVTQKQVSNCKSNEIKLKDITIQVNNSLSSNVLDYLINPDDIDNFVISALKLDTSNVNINNIGTYTYTITYNKKIYNGTINIKSKDLPVVDTMTLNTLSYEVNSTLPSDISSYIKETLSDEVKSGISLDISNVNVAKPGSYLYSVSYNGKIYTSTITIYEPKISSTKTITSNTNKENSN